MENAPFGWCDLGLPFARSVRDPIGGWVERGRMGWVSLDLNAPPALASHSPTPLQCVLL